jgi:hypothetical protein
MLLQRKTMKNRVRILGIRHYLTAMNKLFRRYHKNILDVDNTSPILLICLKSRPWNAFDERAISFYGCDGTIKFICRRNEEFNGLPKAICASSMVKADSQRVFPCSGIFRGVVMPH